MEALICMRFLIMDQDNTAPADRRGVVLIPVKPGVKGPLIGGIKEQRRGIGSLGAPFLQLRTGEGRHESGFVHVFRKIPIFGDIEPIRKKMF